MLDVPADTRQLDLSYRPVDDKDLAALQGLTSLQQLDLSSTQISDAGLAHLQGLTTLQQLNLTDTQVSDISPLRKLINLEWLSLENTEVTDLFPLQELKCLHSLDLTGSQVRDISPLQHVYSLRALDISATVVSDLSPLRELTALESLSFWAAAVIDLSPLREQTGLQILDASGTAICDLLPLRGLTALQRLNLSGTDVIDLSPLGQLTSLQSINLYNTPVSDIMPLRSLSVLQRLSLGGTQVRDLSPLRALTALRALRISGTQIGDLNPLQKLTNLESLNIGDTQVGDLSPLRELGSLQSLDLSRTQVSDLSPLENLLTSGQLRELILGGVNLRAQPPELAEAGDSAAALRSYFEDLRRGATRNTDLKLVLVGNGRVGKTTLKHCLVHGEPPPEPIQERTHGIDATTLVWPAGGEEFRVTIWDLAGQEIYHTMHRFLLHPRVVFLLLWAEETEETDPRELHPVSYWLDLIRQLGSGSVTILVKNQIDRGQKHGTRPPELVGVENPVAAEEAVSAAQGRRIGALRATISEEIERFRDRWGYLLPTSWLAVRTEVERLRDSGHRELPFAQFEQLCAAHDARHPRILADYLGQSGFLFYRPGHFGDQLILDQDWLLERIYAVFDPRSQTRQRILRADGRLFADDTAWVWPDHDPDERQLFLGFLTGAELAFHVEGSDPAEYVVPALLPAAPPAFRPGTGSDDLWLEVGFGTLHRALIERLIVRLSGMSPRRRWWRDGIDIEAEDGSWQASVEARPGRSVLAVRIHPIRVFAHGTSVQREVAAALLRQISELLPGAEPVIAGSLDGMVYVDLDELERARAEGKLRCVDRSRQEAYDVARFAALPSRAELERAGGEYLNPEERPMTAEPQKIRIFVSYAHEDEELKKVLMKRLKGIERSYPIESWDDRRILAGTLVHEEILKRLNAADITLLLITPDFVTSDYCWTHEMEIALEQYQREGKLPVPIIVRRTPEWHEAKIGQHLALPQDGKWLTRWPSPDDFWGEVEEGLRDLIRDLMEKRGILSKRS